MSVDIFNFLEMLNENEKDAHGNPGIDPVKQQEKHAKERSNLADQQSNKDIEEHHIHRMRKSLSRFKTEVQDCTKELEPDQFRFCPSQSGKKDLEVSHKHPKGKSHKVLKIELKGKKAGGRTEASQYAIPLDKELTVPHYDHEGNPILDSEGKHQTTTFTPRDYLEKNPIASNIKKCVDNCNGDEQCIKNCHKTKNKKGEEVRKPLRTDVWNPETTQPGERPAGWFARTKEIIRSIPDKIKQRLKIGKIKHEGLHHTVEKALPHLLGSLGTHATISGNDDDITVIHHLHGGDENGKGRHEDRDELEHLFGQMGLHATHEPHEITGTSGSPHITYPDTDNNRGSHAMLRITHKHPTEEQKQKAKQNAETLKN